jgi:hypothetical protein
LVGVYSALCGRRKNRRDNSVFHVAERLHEPVAFRSQTLDPRGSFRTQQDVFWGLLTSITGKVSSGSFKIVKGESELLQIIAALAKSRCFASGLNRWK